MSELPRLMKGLSVDITETEPFANDKLGRKECADALTGVVRNTTGPLVISLNGGWGTGKTTLLKMWEHELRKQDYAVMYFSAWEDDYCYDALLALIGQMWKQFKGSDFDEIAQSIKECVAPVFRNTIFNLTRTVTGGIVDLNADQLKSVSEKAVDEYLQAGEGLRELKRRLGEFAAKAIGKDSKLVIVIDELDRCRPTFAIELLEKVKHLFDIEGIVFVLGIDREQLGYSIKSVYGQDMDVDGYLRRFIDMEFMLPVGQTRSFWEHLYKQLGLYTYFEERRAASKGHLNDYHIFIELSDEFAKCFDLSLRDMEHYARMLALACCETDKNKYIYPYLLSILIVLKMLNAELYSEYASGACDFEKVIKFIHEQRRGRELLDGRRGVLIEAFLFASSPTKWRDLAYNQMVLQLENKELTQPRYLSDRVKNMERRRFEEFVNFVPKLTNGFDAEISEQVLGYLTDKIEISSLMLGYIK